MRVRTIIRNIIIIAVIVIGGLIAITLYRDYKRQQTGIEWFNRQKVYLDDLETFAGTMDDVVTLYLSGGYSESVFLEHVDFLKKELDAVQTDYNQYLEAHPIRVSTETYGTKEGAEAISDCFDIFQDTLSMLKAESGDTTNLLYNYKAYQQKLIDSCSKYLAAKQELADNGELVESTSAVSSSSR